MEGLTSANQPVLRYCNLRRPLRHGDQSIHSRGGSGSLVIRKGSGLVADIDDSWDMRGVSRTLNNDRGNSGSKEEEKDAAEIDSPNGDRDPAS